ncbi:MAG: HAMP domain-containing histidine kinase [Chloroflexota bacterium]|nr:HAMP domain-containing histidine kinase [Chloroflexota bacterium]
MTDQPGILLLVLVIPLVLVLVALAPRSRSGDAGSRALVLEPESQSDERSHDISPLHLHALDLVDDAVLLLDASRVVVAANRAARDGHGVEPGRPLIESLRDYELEQLLRGASDEGQDRAAVIQLSRSRRVVRAVARPCREHGLVLVLGDETRVRHLEQVRRELVANISHELRNPIATLQLLVDTLTEGAQHDEQMRPFFLDKIKEQVSHLSDIVQQSLYLASLESGERPAQLALVRPADLVARSTERLRPLANQKQVEVEVVVPSDIPDVRADADQIERVLVNLLDNAIRWTPSAGRIRVCAQQDGSNVRFEVHDTGPGVPADRLPRLFERFYTGDESRAGAGTGLGLSIAKHAVQMHGGQIWVESEEGHGAIFFFTLPC